jgi:hypothetical protein
MAKRVKVPISTARTKLFQLADLVRKSADDAVVVLEQRGETEAVALVRESRLAYLEDRVMQIDKGAAAPFTVAGSLATDLDDGVLEQALHEIRQGWASGGTEHPAPAPPRKPRRRAR